MVSAGIPRTNVLGAPGFQGPAGTGVHGIGVSTPNAAAVAAATVGFAKELHIPNGGTLVIGAISVIFAAGRPSAVTRGSKTANVDGAAPNGHTIIAPAATALGI